MKLVLGTSAAVVATLAVAALAHGAEAQSRAGYVARVEPICKRNTEASKRILAGASKRIKKRNLAPAGKQFVHASRSFGGGIQADRPGAAAARRRGEAAEVVQVPADRQAEGCSTSARR